jgi:four helix bundle protein
LNFLNIAQASLAEVGYCIHVAQRLGYISEAVANELELDVKQVGAPLAGLIRSARLKLAATTGAAVILIGALVVRLA